MPSLQVHLPEDLYREVKARQIKASELFQQAVRAEVQRQELLERADRYLAELVAEVGEPSAEDEAWAEQLLHGIADSAVDAMVVATAEPGGVVITGDVKDLAALAYHAAAVEIREV
jgi:post-segregation antitoxin (ccd killing protein)